MDSLFLYIEINGIFILLLVVLLANMNASNMRSTDEKYFSNAIILNILVLVADTGTWIFDGRVFFNTLWLNKLVFFAYYLFTALFVYAWALYSSYKLQVNWNKLKKNIWLVTTPMIIAVIISIVSLWNGCLFTFDSNGVYERGTLFGVHTAILWIYLLLSFVSVINIMLSDRREELFRECLAMMIAVIFPVVGGILQTAFYGLNMAWTGSCISYVLMFISIQNKQINLDALTNVHNRGSFERTLRESVEKKKEGQDLYLIMIDINKFKQINDKFGHIVGDRALVEMSKGLQSIAIDFKTDFLARYGGDEFVILCWRKDEEQIKELIQIIDRKCKSISKNRNLGFDISVSMGWAKYDADAYATVEKFIAAADEKMYEIKKTAI